MEVNPLHPEKARLPIEATEFGIVNEDKPLQPWKAANIIDVTEMGMIKSPVKPVQYLKAYCSIVVKESGMVR